MGLLQNSGKDRPAVIQTYGSVWITCVWIGGMDRPAGSGYGSGLYILTRSHIYICICICIYICMYVCIYIYVYVHIYMYVCIYIDII